MPKVVIIGAGIVGCALADELTARGWTDVTVLDQGPLFATGGSSSHAPGLVFQTNGSKAMADFAQYTVKKYVEIGGFRQVGGLELATSPERLAELHRRQGWATAWGIDARVIDPRECAALHPIVDADRILGGLHVPSDGAALTVAAGETQARAAQTRGAVFLGGHEVLDISTSGDRVVGVVTSHGNFPADIVVCCAGIWGPKVARMAGLALPLTPLAHQLAWTGQVSPLTKNDRELVHPILRHQDRDLYFRERFDQLGIGWYGHRPLPMEVDDILSVDAAEVMPSMLPFTEADFAPAWDFTQELFPSTRDAKLDMGFNGLFSFTTDNMPLLGESPDVAGFWVAEAVWVTHSAGVAMTVAEWLVDGVTTIDTHDCDINRFEPHQRGPEYVRMRDCQNYIEVYDILHPLQPMEEPRPLRTTPFYPRQQELGAFFLEANGWERPQWYEANALLVDGRDIPVPNDWAARYWSPIAGAEAQVTRERVAMFDMTALKRIEVSGRGALAFLQEQCTGQLDKAVGSVTYCLLLDERGGVRSDITVARLGPNEFQVGANGNLDVDRLSRAAAGGAGDVFVRDTTAGTCCVGIWGPRARDVVQPLTRADLTNDGLRYFRGTRTYIGQVPVTALRLSYVGELGWELYTTADLGLKLWDTLWEAGQAHGVIAAGRAAFNSLRLEKGYRSFGADMTPEHDPYEAGLGFAVHLKKPSFIGRSAVVDRAEPRRRLTCLGFDDPADQVLGKEPVYDGDRCVGYVTSAAWGYTVGHGIAYAWLPASLTTPGQTVHIGYFDRRVPATVREEPLFDPGMERLRS
jgi:glycine cleavage system aminomethyltransferase T/glycine/D-amino acid oxidase-like deaminating enzyme